MGARRIILLGYDMQIKGKQTHWFGDHQDKSVSQYQSFRVRFDQMAGHAKELGLDIINCTRDTALTCFRKINLEDCLTQL